MATTWVTLDDVVDAYEGDIEPGRAAWVMTVVRRAERLLLRKRPAVLANIAAGTVSVEDAKLAVVTAVLRVVRNPEGYQSETEGNYVYQKSRDVAGGKLFFEGDDLALVTPVGSGKPGQMIVGIPPQRVPGLR